MASKRQSTATRSIIKQTLNDVLLGCYHWSNGKFTLIVLRPNLSLGSLRRTWTWISPVSLEAAHYSKRFKPFGYLISTLNFSIRTDCLIKKFSEEFEVAYLSRFESSFMNKKWNPKINKTDFITNGREGCTKQKKNRRKTIFCYNLILAANTLEFSFSGKLSKQFDSETAM